MKWRAFSRMPQWVRLSEWLGSTLQRLIHSLLQGTFGIKFRIATGRFATSLRSCCRQEFQETIDPEYLMNSPVLLCILRLHYFCLHGSAQHEPPRWRQLTAMNLLLVVLEKPFPDCDLHTPLGWRWTRLQPKEGLILISMVCSGINGGNADFVLPNV